MSRLGEMRTNCAFVSYAHVMANYQLEIEDAFSAAHAIVIQGQREPLHGHDWRVTVTIEGPELDTEGLLVDFHLVHRQLSGIIGRFHNNNLNEVSPFDQANPTAELVARHIGEELSRELLGRIPEHVRVASVRLTEAVGCAAVWIA